MNFIKQLFKFGGESDFGKVRNTLVTLIGFAIIIMLWHFVAAYELIPTKVLPDPFNVIGSVGSLITDYHLFGNIWFTVSLNLMCYVYAILLSLPIGFFLALYPVNNILFGKSISSVRYLPLPALTGLFVAILGLTFSMKTWFLTVCIMIYIIPTVVNKINDLQKRILLTGYNARKKPIGNESNIAYT